MPIPQLTKPKYSAEQVNALYSSSRDKGQVTTNGITYFYLNGDSMQFRTVVLFREDGQLERALEAAEKEVKALDPDIIRVSCMEYHDSHADMKSAVRKFTVYSGSLH